MRVLKFGGSSLANHERLFDVAKLLASQAADSQLLVILSAPQGVTNALVELSEVAYLGYDYTEAVSKLEKKLTGLVAEFSCLSEGQISSLNQLIHSQMQQISSQLEGIKLLNYCPDHVKAQIISTGEKVSVNLMADLLSCLEVKSHVLDATKCIQSSDSYLHLSLIHI